VRSILKDAGREDDYLEIGLGGSLQWNPLDDPLLDSYSMAYGVASLINQLFGKSREPFWQQAFIRQGDPDRYHIVHNSLEYIGL